jgi:hypothetical protein
VRQAEYFAVMRGPNKTHTIRKQHNNFVEVIFGGKKKTILEHEPFLSALLFRDFFHITESKKYPMT